MTLPGAPDESGSRSTSAGAHTAKNQRRTSAGFAPSDLLDGRKRGDWESRYQKAATTKIWLEFWYLVVLLIIGPLGLGGVFFLKKHFHDQPTGLLSNCDPVWRGMSAWLGGMLGGTLFSAKWLYHSVAKWVWNEDRRLWRFFTPHLSAGLAFAVVMLASSGLFRIFDAKALDSLKGVVALAFLAGYFSDSAIAKLTDIANTVFGTSRHSPTGTESGGRLGDQEAHSEHEEAGAHLPKTPDT